MEGYAGYQIRGDCFELSVCVSISTYATAVVWRVNRCLIGGNNCKTKICRQRVSWVSRPGGEMRLGKQLGRWSAGVACSPMD